ncbi:YbdD/YjiX family protein [Agromyces sp. NPDC056523]|uniref:YbdD/YjiX family protein n=1 Tax=Agromyces sp. NPDC056523 TaxID=3345850 RepID=UPI00366BE59F
MADATVRRPARTPAVRAGAAASFAVAADVVLRGCRGVAWYVRDLMGDNAYRVYLEHHAAHHGPEHPPLSERAFWRQRMDEQDRNPGARCC